MECDRDALVSYAQDGSPDAQYELALRLRDGVGLPQDREQSETWLKSAAHAGHPGAQTQFAILLRSTNDSAKERESVEWLRRAAEQGDSLARFTLALQLFEGIGAAVDRLQAGTLFMMSSLRGFKDARDFLATFGSAFSVGEWKSIFELVKWPYIQFVMGPPAEKNLRTSFRKFQKSVDPEQSDWFQHERKQARDLFLSQQGSSVLDVVYDDKVGIGSIYCGVAIVDDIRTVAVTIDIRNTVTATGWPVYWPPDQNALDVLSATVAFTHAREWVKSGYMAF